MDLRVLSTEASRPMAETICTHLGIHLSPCTRLRFENDNLFVRIEENVREADVAVVATSCTPVDSNLMETLMMIDALGGASPRRITVVLPSYPYARSDKKDQPRVAITARLVADLLVTAGASRILTVDLHAGQIQGFFNIPFDHLTAMPLLCEHFLKGVQHPPVVVATDAGAARRADAFARRIGAPLAVGMKRRVGNTDSVQGIGFIGEVKGCHALIAEDEIVTAGTVAATVEALRQREAAAITVACTHAVLAPKGNQRLQELQVDEVVVTDTMPVSPEKRFPGLTVLSVAPMLGEALRRIHEGESVSGMFNT